MKDETKTLLSCIIQVTPFDSIYEELDHELFLSKNLYNTCVYIIRQLIFKKRDCTDPVLKSTMKGYMTGFELSKMLQDEDNVDYRALPAAAAQQVCKQVDKAFKAYFAACKEGLTPELPKYLDKVKGRNKLSFAKNGILKNNLKNGFITLVKLGITFKLPEYIDCESVQQIDIIKTGNRTIKVIIIYAVPKVEMKKNNNRILGIDVGVNNLMAVVSNTNDFKPIIYDGRPIKEINQFCNKYVAKYKSLSKNVITERICSIYRNRENKINDCFHKIVNDLINQAVSNDFSVIVIGKNKGWKQEVKLGDQNNQNFVCIPHNLLIKMIKYKAALHGITVIETEESYTSICSFFDNEFPCYHENYKGDRVKRGLFKSSLGFINADLNAALNIIRKVFPEFSCETANLSINHFKNVLKVSPKMLCNSNHRV